MTATFDSVVNDVLRTLSGYGLVQDRQSPLASDVGISALSLRVSDATGFEQGVIEVGTEAMYVISVDYSSNILTIAAGGRGYYGTTAATHAAGDQVTMAPVFPRDQVAGAVNETIVNTYPTLFGVGTATLTYSPVISTYDLPDDCDRVLGVRAETIGPSRELVTLRRWSFNSVAPDGNQITLEEGGFPGRNVYVTYGKIPSELTWGDTFTASGLRESAKTAIRYGAASQLVAFMDVSRLSVGTAEADQFDTTNSPVGTASKISAQLYQRYQIELDNERRRQRLATPAVVNVRTR